VTFLFDIGRVLLDFHFESSLARLLPAGCDDGPGRLVGLLDRKDEFESGLIHEDDYIPWALEKLGSPAGHGEFIHAWRDIFTPVEPMWRTVERLSADGHRLILFSNTNSIHCPWIFENYGIFRHFPEAVLSFEAKAIKPDAAIYEHAVSRHGLTPSETLYIDDLGPNCDTGRAFGFRTWQYDLTDHASFERWLDAELSR